MKWSGAPRKGLARSLFSVKSKRAQRPREEAVLNAAEHSQIIPPTPPFSLTPDGLSFSEPSDLFFSFAKQGDVAENEKRQLLFRIQLQISVFK